MFISRIGATPNNQNFGMKVKTYSRIENPGNPVIASGREILQTLAPESKSTVTIYAVKGRDTLQGWIEPDPAVRAKVNALANTTAVERSSLDRSEFHISLTDLKDAQKRKEFEQKTLLGYEKWLKVHIRPTYPSKS